MNNYLHYANCLREKHPGYPWVVFFGYLHAIPISSISSTAPDYSIEIGHIGKRQYEIKELRLHKCMLIFGEKERRIKYLARFHKHFNGSVILSIKNNIKYTSREPGYINLNFMLTFDSFLIQELTGET